MFDLFVKYWWQFCVVAIVSYFVGNINFAVIFSKGIKKKDVRQFGSGNPGTTNMYRIFGIGMGFLTFVCDCLKGVACCLVALLACKSLGEQACLEITYFAGLFVVLGHVFPVVFRFKGGKGVATSIGAMFVMQPIFMLCCVIPILALILIFDRMSVMSITLSVFIIVWTWTVFLSKIGLFCCTVLTVIFSIVIFAHRHNIVRIFKGQEKAMGIRNIFRKKRKTECVSCENIDKEGGNGEE